MAKTFRLTGEKLIEIPIFNNLNVYEGEVLLDITSTKVFKENDVVIKEGSPGDALFIILEGVVDIVKKIDDNRFKTLARFGPDHAFGEGTLINRETSLRSASGIARSRTRVLTIYKDDFHRLLDFGSIVAYKVTLNLARILAERQAAVDRELIEIINKVDDKSKTIIQEFMHKKLELNTKPKKRKSTSS
ncbi:MAG: cyclic nucleotide-binding domain-containing protein [Candidatus Cloacimonetes bacterium]|nr:cyclic nucleotide-binding domain-containing protein [Candidatus Cloacimonadota bacterium]